MLKIVKILNVLNNLKIMMFFYNVKIYIFSKIEKKNEKFENLKKLEL